MRLYELTGGYKNLSDIVETDVLTKEIIEAALITVMGDISEKAQNMSFLIENIKSDIESLEKEIKRLQGRKSSFENSKENIQSYLQGCLEVANIDKLKTTTHSIWIQNNPPSVNILDPLKIPKKYKIHINEWKPNIRMISDAMKLGEKVRGAELTQSKGIRIR